MREVELVHLTRLALPTDDVRRHRRLNSGKQCDVLSRVPKAPNRKNRALFGKVWINYFWTGSVVYPGGPAGPSVMADHAVEHCLRGRHNNIGPLQAVRHIITIASDPFVLSGLAAMDSDPPAQYVAVGYDHS